MQRRCKTSIKRQKKKKVVSRSRQSVARREQLKQRKCKTIKTQDKNDGYHFNFCLEITIIRYKKRAIDGKTNGKVQFLITGRKQITLNHGSRNHARPTAVEPNRTRANRANMCPTIGDINTAPIINNNPRSKDRAVKNVSPSTHPAPHSGFCDIFLVMCERRCAVLCESPSVIVLCQSGQPTTHPAPHSGFCDIFLVMCERRCAVLCESPSVIVLCQSGQPTPRPSLRILSTHPAPHSGFCDIFLVMCERRCAVLCVSPSVIVLCQSGRPTPPLTPDSCHSAVSIRSTHPAPHSGFCDNIFLVMCERRCAVLCESPSVIVLCQSGQPTTHPAPHSGFCDNIFLVMCERRCAVLCESPSVIVFSIMRAPPHSLKILISEV
ncbi:hypothetical protein J6590_024157 [Homalodisca vitripennis]|nr:hypothetical protein J6590_024157 [Homalodisca vitripennis]